SPHPSTTVIYARSLHDALPIFTIGAVRAPLHAGQARNPTTGHAATESFGQRAHLLFLDAFDLGLCVTNRREHQVGEGLCGFLTVTGVDGLGVDGDVLDLSTAAQLDLDQATTGAALDLRVVECLLCFDELLLHLLGLLEQGLHVHSTRVHGRLLVALLVLGVALSLVSVSVTALT